MKKIAVFPGSFDPITLGHESIIKRALPLFDRIIVAVGTNAQKSYMFSLEKRVNLIKQTFINEGQVSVETYEGLTVDFCRKKEAGFILRGLRNTQDFEFEKGIAQMNRAMAEGVETVFLMTAPEFSAISSTIVRDIKRNGGDIFKFLPSGTSID